jgi:cell division protein FtsI (penicillin-binding protein 3)
MTDDRDPWDPYGMFAGGPARTTTRTDRPRSTAPEPSRPRTRARRPEVVGPEPSPRPRPRPRARQAAPPRRPAVRAASRPRHADPARRIKWVRLGFLLLFVAVVARLGQLQVVAQAELEARGEQQRTRTLTLSADRGSLVDRNGQDLALSLPLPTVFADPSQVQDPEATAAALAPVLGLPADDLVDRLDGDGEFAWLARQVPAEVGEEVAALELEGIHLLEEQARFNPAGDMLRSVLGDVNVDSVGRSGLELQYDELLLGEPGSVVVETGTDGRTIPGSRHVVEAARAGDDLVLTIDRSLQYAAEAALAAQIERMGAQGGTVIISVPHTGEVLAMANLTVPEGGGPAVPSSENLALTAVFEPGSVNKVITLAAALEEGIVSPASVLTVPDHLQVSDHLFTDHDPHPTNQWTPTDIMATSSNIGTIMLAQELGEERVDSYIRRFGFGERTALGFPHESPGILSPVEDWSGTSIGSIPIGQGIAVTAMQMLGAYNVIANEGVYVEPRLVSGTVDSEGTRHDMAAGTGERVVSEGTARAVRDMMVAVVDAGTGQEAAIDGYAVAGKTGTARKPQANGTYQDGAGNYHYVTTFAGFVPAQDPQLSIIVVVDEPSNSTYASAVSAPVFAELARYGLRHLRIPPPAQPLVSTVPAPVVAEEPIVVAQPDTGPVRSEPAVATTTTTTTTVPPTTDTTIPGAAPPTDTTSTSVPDG